METEERVTVYKKLTNVCSPSFKKSTRFNKKEKIIYFGIVIALKSKYVLTLIVFNSQFLLLLETKPVGGETTPTKGKFSYIIFD
jgi:hypothetical protein